MINKKYDIIYADPPWSYETWSKKGHGRSAEHHYKTMNPDDIKKIPVTDWVSDDAVLFLWVTPPCLIEGLELITAWGFEYKTKAFNWVKYNANAPTLFEPHPDDYKVGMGYYTRANSEDCLLATRGKPFERLSRSVLQVIAEPIREHSRKPDCTRDRIVELFGDRPRLEMFARTRTPGWDVWGNETEKF